MKINIIGGGLAGCALAYVFKQAGHDPVIFEAGDSLASGASGNDIGLYNPRFTAQMDASGKFYSAAFAEALKVFEDFSGRIDWNPCGALHLITNDKKAARFPKTLESWEWPEDDMRIVSAAEASEISGVDIAHDALYLARSGTVSPKKLCRIYAQNADVHLNTRIDDLDALDGEITVIASGMGCLQFKQTENLPLKAVRGQLTHVRETEHSSKLRCALNYGGYMTPAQSGLHYVGSTFQRWLDHSDVIAQDDQDNLDNLFKAVPALQAEYDIAGNRAGVRTTSSDHMPIIGRVDENIYVSTAHGSHGILSSLIGARIIANMTVGHPFQVDDDVLDAIAPR